MQQDGLWLALRQILTSSFAFNWRRGKKEPQGDLMEALKPLRYRKDPGAKLSVGMGVAPEFRASTVFQC